MAGARRAAGRGQRRRRGAGARTRARPRGMHEPRARAVERAGQRPDAARIRGARHADRKGRRPGGRDPRREADRRARNGTAARRRARQRPAAARRRAAARAEERGREGRRARPRRQRDHVRHRRHLDQAGREHGQDEGRHVGRRRRAVRDGRDVAPQRAGPLHRRDPDDREHARAAAPSSRATC